MTIDREAVEAFLEETNNTNFEIIARGNGLEGSIQPAIVKETKIFGTTPKTEVRARYSGYMGGSGMKRGFELALNAAQGDDFVHALEILVNSYFYQVELRPLTSVDTLDPRGGIASNKANPLATTLEPLVWHKDPESGKWGGTRPGAGRPRQRIKLDSEAANALESYLKAHPETTASEVVSKLVQQL